MKIKMKKIFSAILLSGLVLASCEFQHPEVIVLPDPSFDVSGLQEYAAISIYEEVPVDLSLSRVYGVSKEMHINISFDEALIAEHNELYGSSYTLMPSEYYDCPEQAVFDANTKKTTLPVKVYVEKLVADKGLAAANNMVIPVHMTSASEEIEDAANMGKVLMKMKIDTPKIEVDVPDPSKLEFISAFPIKQTIQVAAAANFTTLDVAKVAFKVDETKVDAFNTANGTSHVLLPAGTYTIKEDVFDAETLSLVSDIEFDCASLSEDNTYILPLVMTQTDVYEVTQTAPVYVVVELAELKISVVSGGELVTVKNRKGVMTAVLNSPITSDFDVNFRYDAAKVAEYNAANGTSYEAPDASKITITPSVVPAGELQAEVAFEIDWADKPYDDGVSLLLPLTLDGILEGTTIIGEKTVYVELIKTLSGNWIVEEVETVHRAAVSGTWGELVGSTIWLADGVTPVDKVTKPASDANHKYVFVYGGGWTDGIMYFDVDFANEIEGKPGCHPIINMQDRVQAGWPGGYDTVTQYNCYFDGVNEEFHWDFTILGWWGPGGGGGAALEDPSHVPGYIKSGRMHSKR